MFGLFKKENKNPFIDLYLNSSRLSDKIELRLRSQVTKLKINQNKFRVLMGDIYHFGLDDINKPMIDSLHKDVDGFDVNSSLEKARPDYYK